MIFGAEGLIGIVNIVLLLGALALITLLVGVIRYKRSASYQQQVKQHAIRYSLIGLLLTLIALPTLAFSLWAGWDYVEQKPRRDAFELNNQHISELYSAIEEDNLERFQQALSICGDYCIHVEPGYKKYDELLISAGHAKAHKIQAYLNTLNQTEVATPQALRAPLKPKPWVEVDVSND